VVGKGNYGFLVAKSLHAYTPAPYEIRGGDGDRCCHRPQDRKSDLHQRAAVVYARFCGQVEEAENTGVAASSEKVPAEVRRDKVTRAPVYGKGGSGSPESLARGSGVTLCVV
jgi:hypothetical protein